jgi:NADH-quinone oxidoreductase subunit C
MSKAVLDRLVGKFGSEVLATHAHRGNETAVLKRERLLEIVQWLRDDPKNRFDLLRDLTAVDKLPLGETPRFEVVIHFYSLPFKHSLRLKLPLDESDLVLPSLTSLYAAADWAERECWDMFGVRFTGHPNLRRILLYEEFEGHPLRKDYDKRRSQPRLDLAAPERDALAEYRQWQSRTQKTP